MEETVVLFISKLETSEELELFQPKDPTIWLLSLAIIFPANEWVNIYHTKKIACFTLYSLKPRNWKSASSLEVMNQENLQFYIEEASLIYDHVFSVCKLSLNILPNLPEKLLKNYTITPQKLRTFRVYYREHDLPIIGQIKKPCFGCLLTYLLVFWSCHDVKPFYAQNLFTYVFLSYRISNIRKNNVKDKVSSKDRKISFCYWKTEPYELTAEISNCRHKCRYTFN